MAYGVLHLVFRCRSWESEGTPVGISANNTARTDYLEAEGTGNAIMQRLEIPKRSIFYIRWVEAVVHLLFDFLETALTDL